LIDTPAWQLPQRPGEPTFKLSAFAQFALGEFSSMFPKRLANFATPPAYSRWPKLVTLYFGPTLIYFRKKCLINQESLYSKSWHLLFESQLND
jgi:hypothetical protein